MQAVNFE